MGLTSTGFVRRTYDDILNDKINRAKELFGQDIDTSELTPLGKILRINAYDQALAEEEIEQVYYSHFPNAATGQNMDRLMPFAGIARTSASISYFLVEVTGEPGYTIPTGFLVGTDTGLTFYNTMPTEIGEDGKCTITVACSESGTVGNVNASAICVIINPEASVESVLGVECVTAGEDEETDAALRKRFRGAIQGMGSCNESSITSALLRVPTVTSAGVIVNDSFETDSAGRPGKSFECYVNGGENYRQEIAANIFAKKPIGVKTCGKETETIIDEGGYPHEIKFTFSEQIVVDVVIAVKVDSRFEENGAADIENNIRTHIDGVGLGETVVPSSLYGHIYTVTGVKEVTALELSIGDQPCIGNIAMDEWQIAVCGDVAVSVVRV